MTRTLDLLEAFIEEPRRAAASLREAPAPSVGVACCLASAASLYLAHALSSGFLPLPRGPVSLAVYCLWKLLATLVLAAVLHLCAELLSGRKASGGVSGLFVLLGLSSLAWTMVLPVVLLLKTLGLDRGLVVWVLVFLAGLLNLALKARSLSDHYSVPSGRAWLLLSMPYLAVGGLAAVMAAGAFVGAVVSLARLFARA